MDNDNDRENYEKPQFDVGNQHKTIEKQVQSKPEREETINNINIIGSEVLPPRPLEAINKISVSSSTEQEQHQIKHVKGKQGIDSFVGGLLSGWIITCSDYRVDGSLS